MRIFVIILVIIAATFAAGYYFGYNIGFKRASDSLAPKDSAIGSLTADLIHVASPKENAVIMSPLIVTGEARGTWYFEASFPIALVDWDGKIIAEHYAEAQSDWMTERFVPFTGTLEFKKPYADTDTTPDFMKHGTLILQKDNPSGLPQFDNAIEIPVLFE